MKGKKRIGGKVGRYEVGRSGVRGHSLTAFVFPTWIQLGYFPCVEAMRSLYASNSVYEGSNPVKTKRHK